MRSGDRAFRFVRASSQAATDTGLLIEGCPSVQSGRHGHRPAHRGFVRPFSQAATDTDLLIEGCPSVQSGRHGHRPAHRGFVRPFSQAATDTDLLIEGSSVLSIRPPRTPPCSSRRILAPAPATDTDLLIEGSSVLSIRPPRTPTCSSRVVRPFDQAATDTALLIEVAVVTASGEDTALLIEVAVVTASGEDTALLIEVAVVLRSDGRRSNRRPSRYDHLRAPAVAPLRRFCEPAFSVRPSVRKFG
jgi:hypothetical protein